MASRALVFGNIFFAAMIIICLICSLFMQSITATILLVVAVVNYSMSYWLYRYIREVEIELLRMENREKLERMAIVGTAEGWMEHNFCGLL